MDLFSVFVQLYHKRNAFNYVSCFIWWIISSFRQPISNFLQKVGRDFKELFTRHF